MSPYEGTVEDITFRSTRVRTFENSLVNIPNSIISNSSIINWSKMEKRRYRIHLCIQLDTPLEKLERFKVRVKEMLQARDAIYDESIIVKFDEIADNGLNVLISSFTDSVDYTSYIAEKEDINYKIMKILREENIELAYDTKTVYVKN
jgi:MscS family membrane protein